MDIRELATDVADGSADAAHGPRLVAVWNGGSVMRMLPAKGSLLIGRGGEADVRIEHTSVSRKHAVLHLGETMTVEDLGGANGTWVEGKRLEARSTCALRPGALFEVGSALLVVQTGERTASRVEPTPEPGGPIVEDPEMARVYQLITLVAKSTLSVILLGETGVGKEVLARRVHALSLRADKPFLKINCAALVESLLESELFGHERGAFTGATQAKAGLLESADGGTLFLDEIGELPLTLQAKLLRVLESGEITRVGSTKPRAVNVRFVAATNRNLRDWVAAGHFRQDLFFRLDGVSIHVPPLRERVSEIPPLALAFAREASAAAGKPPVEISADAMARLVHHLWPGNIRELRNVIARSVLLCPSHTIRPSDLRFEGLGTAPSSPPPPMSETALPRPSSLPPAPPKQESEDERRIVDALERSGGNQTRAAKMLGISRKTLLKRLDAMKVPRPRKREDSA